MSQAERAVRVAEVAIKERDRHIEELEKVLQEVRIFLEIHADGWPESTGGWELWEKVRAALSSEPSEAKEDARE